MAQDRTADLEAELLAGARGVVSKKEGLLERLAKEFAATDLVTIVNVLPERFGWVYTDPKETQIEQPNSSTKRINFGDPKTRILESGESKVIPGWEAYIALDRMWKMYAQQDIEKISFVLQSADEMENFLRKAYKGVFDPNTVGNGVPGFDSAAPAPVAPASSPEEALAQKLEAAPTATIAPTQDPGLGFEDEDNGDQNQPPVVPPLHGQEFAPENPGNAQTQQQQPPQLPPELQ